jgi:hypothetical protein
VSSRTTPAFLHDVLGERFVPGELAVVLGVAVGVATYVTTALAEPGLPIWRLVCAWVLIADIAAGCLANFTAGTNDFYAARPPNRWAFLAIHFHVIGVSWALSAPLMPSIGVWAYTIAAGILVNLSLGRRGARFLAAALLVLGGVGLSVLDVPRPLALVFALFYVKVAYAFALDHTAPADVRPARPTAP